jgi:hypothetical protein
MTEESVFCSCAQQRGKAKEGNFFERLRKMQVEEERLRNPLAQGLPYTTEEPEVSHFSSGYALSNFTLLGVSELLKKTMFPSILQIPAKPPTREPTEPIDRVLHSEARVVRRVKFDSQVSCPL